MSTHNICFSREINKILCGYPLLSVAMNNAVQGLITLLKTRIVSLCVVTMI